MSKRIYIDANIYLGFFNSNKPEFKKLLDSLIELKDNIFISTQIVNEINRNKLNIFNLSIGNYIRQVDIISTHLPEHLDDDYESLKEWNKRRKELEEQIISSNHELKTLLLDLLVSISCSKDKVSLKLSSIFSRAIEHSPRFLNKAKDRKEVGNPPGKYTDCLGDQLSWEILLNEVANIEELWIVSKDKDYFTEQSKSVFLNPILYNDLIALNPEIKINLFDKLSEALKDYNTKEVVKALPNSTELDLISKTEETISSPNYYNSSSSDSGKPNYCPTCQSKDSFTNGAYLRSRYGGLTLQFVCTKCGYSFDTGDPFD